MSKTKVIAVRLTVTDSQYKWLLDQGWGQREFNNSAFILDTLGLAYDDFPQGFISRGGNSNSKGWNLLRRKNTSFVTKVQCRSGRWDRWVILDTDTDEERRDKKWYIMGVFPTKEEALKTEQAFHRKLAQVKENAMKEDQSHE